MNSPPMVGVACLSSWSRWISAESAYIRLPETLAQPANDPWTEKNGQRKADHGGEGTTKGNFFNRGNPIGPRANR